MYNEHAKLACTPPNWYKAMLCTIKEYFGTELHCEPLFACSLSNIKVLYYALMHHMCMYVMKFWKMSRVTPTSHRHRSPLCTTQPNGAQHRSVVHNIVWYQRGGAQCRSHKPRRTDGWKAMHMSPPCLSTGGLKKGRFLLW